MCEDDDFKYAVAAMELDDIPVFEGTKKTINVCEKVESKLQIAIQALEEIAEWTGWEGEVASKALDKIKNKE